MCWVCHQISLIPEKVHLKRKQQCLDQLYSHKLRLCSSRAKHKMNISGNLSHWKLTTIPGSHRFSGCDLAETSPPCVLPSLLFFLFFLKRNHLTIRLSQIRREIAYQLASLRPVHEALMSQLRHLASYLGILKSIFTGCISKRGGSPSPSSMAVMPKDQTSQRAS